MGHCSLIRDQVIYLIGGITENNYRRCNNRNTILVISYNLVSQEIHDLSYSFPPSLLPVDSSLSFSFLRADNHTNFYPVPCSRFSCFILPTRLGFTLFGGYSNKQWLNSRISMTSHSPLNDLWEFDLHDHCWRLLHALEPDIPVFPGEEAVLTKELLIVVGG